MRKCHNFPNLCMDYRFRIRIRSLHCQCTKVQQNYSSLDNLWLLLKAFATFPSLTSPLSYRETSSALVTLKTVEEGGDWGLCCSALTAETTRRCDNQMPCKCCMHAPEVQLSLSTLVQTKRKKRGVCREIQMVSPTMSPTLLCWFNRGGNAILWKS